VSRYGKTGQSGAGSEYRGAIYENSCFERFYKCRQCQSVGPELASVGTCSAYHRRWTMAQTYIHQRRATAHPGATAQGTKSGAGSKRHLVTEACCNGCCANISSRVSEPVLSDASYMRRAMAPGAVAPGAELALPCVSGKPGLSQSMIRKHRRNNV
jgi:hypothetical protein